jgi:hypothetical protein
MPRPALTAWADGIQIGRKAGQAMTRRQRNELVAVRAAFILADEPAVKAYTLHFEAQMRRGKVRRLLYAGYMHFARTAVILSGLDAREIQ